MQNSNKPARGKGLARKGKKKASAHLVLDEAFQQKVERLDKLMKLAAKPTANPALQLNSGGGTLEQVGREADSAWSGVKRIMQLLNVETKAVNISAVNTPTNAGALVANLTAAISQGVGDNQRTGDSIKLTHLRLKMRMYYTSDLNAMTLALVLSKDGVPVVADVFQTLGDTVYSGMSDENHDQRGADTWIWYKTMQVSTYEPARYIEVNLPLQNHVLYSAASTTVSSGCLSLWAIVAPGVASNGVVVQATLSFVDN